MLKSHRSTQCAGSAFVHLSQRSTARLLLDVVSVLKSIPGSLIYTDSAADRNLAAAGPAADPSPAVALDDAVAAGPARPVATSHPGGFEGPGGSGRWSTRAKRTKVVSLCSAPTLQIETAVGSHQGV